LVVINNMGKKALILFAHPALEKSRVNKFLIQGLNDKEGVYFHDLYQAYPDFDIDVEFEQDLLLKSDIIAFMHPFYWYSTPAILKEWQDLVLTHGWAYGSKGNALSGKKMFSIITTGGPSQAYHHQSTERFTLKELLAPIEQTARLCKMEYLPPFAVHGTHGISKETLLEAKNKLDQYLLELLQS
jgi:glutathione-regulated potassium-efflux system ancillary protein KefG